MPEPIPATANVSGPAKIPVRARLLLHEPGGSLWRWLLGRWTAETEIRTPSRLASGWCRHATVTRRGMDQWIAGYRAALADLGVSDTGPDLSTMAWQSGAFVTTEGNDHA